MRFAVRGWLFARQSVRRLTDSLFARQFGRRLTKFASEHDKAPWKRTPVVDQYTDAVGSLGGELSDSFKVPKRVIVIWFIIFLPAYAVFYYSNDILAACLSWFDTHGKAYPSLSDPMREVARSLLSTNKAGELPSAHQASAPAEGRFIYSLESLNFKIDRLIDHVIYLCGHHRLPQDHYL